MAGLPAAACRDFNSVWRECVDAGRCADLGDGGMMDAGFGDAGAGAANPVKGRLFVFHQLSEGEVAVPFDLTSAPLVAWIAVDGGFRRLSVAGNDAGDFSVDGVPPAATYSLDYAGSTFVTSSERSVDLSAWRLGRPDAVVPTPNTWLQLQGVTGLSPWQAGDELHLVSLRAGTVTSSLGRIAGPLPAPGATSVDGLQVDFGRHGFPLISASRGDSVQLLQHVQEPTDAGYFRLVADRLLQSTSLEMAAGSIATLDGGMSALTRSRSASFDWRASEFENQLMGAQRGAAFVYSSLAVTALPRGNAAGAYGPAPDLVRAVRTVQSPADLKLTFSYANPFGGTDELVQAVCVAVRFYSVPGATAYPALVGSLTAGRLDAHQSSPVRPLVVAPVEPQINGKDLLARQSQVGLTPVISWSPSAATLHAVDVVRIQNSGGRTEARLQATFHVYGSSVQIPPGVLQQGGEYFAFVTAVSLPQDRPVAPFRRQVPMGWASVASDTFTP